MMLGRTVSRSAALRAQIQRTASTQCALNEEFPGVPALSGSPGSDSPASVSTIGNGFKLVTKLGEPGVSLALTVGAGSRDETDETAGATHLLRHLAFKNCESRSEIALARELQDSGVTFTACAGRESITYKVDLLPEVEKIDVAMRALADTVLRPRLRGWDLDTPREVASWEVSSYSSSPSALVAEELYAAAFHDEGLGRNFFNVDDVASADTIASFRAATFGADRMTLVASGADVSALATELFGDVPAASAKRATSAYKAGESRTRAVCGEAHVAIGFEGFSRTDNDAAAACVLAAVLQNGGTDVFNDMHSDGGLFGVQGCAPGAEGQQLVEGLVAALKGAAASAADNGAVEQAKTRVQLDLLTASRECRMNELAHSTLASGQPTEVSTAAKRVASVTAADVQRVAQRIVGGAPTIASYGAISSVPRYNALTQMLS